MKRIVILDTWVNDTNLGNKVIMEAVCKELREMFPHAFFYHVPALEYIQAGRKLIEDADLIFLAGTNVLSSDMDKTSDWRLRMSDVHWMKGVVLMGLGWWQYQTSPPNQYTRLILRRTLASNRFHSVRDSYTADRMKALGFNVLNTGCPTLWKLSDDHCATIPRDKANKALLTFTEYNQIPSDDRRLFEIIRRNYEVVYFWPQMYGDFRYAQKISRSDLVFIDPSIEALDDLLKQGEMDYIGTRLHAGIRALTHGRRAIIVAIDNRGAEMGRDFNLPTLLRGELEQELEDRINTNWATDVQLDDDAIANWKNQFDGPVAVQPARRDRTLEIETNS